MAEIFWDTLGIAPTTDTKKIRKAYSELVKKHNPEDDEEAFRKINQAYRAAMNLARQLSALNVSDDNLVITDRREDGTFGLQIRREGGRPDILPVPGPVLENEKAPEDTDPLYDFGSIDSTLIKGLTYQEIDDMTGKLTLAPGYHIPDGDKARAIKKFIDDNDIVRVLSVRTDPSDLEKGMREALNTAEKIIKDESVRGEIILWDFYFNSPCVVPLFTHYDYYRELEDMVDTARLSSHDCYSIADACPLRPRVYVVVNKPAGSVAKVDFLSNVAFRYKAGRYPEFDTLMKKEQPADVKELIGFLEHLSLNLYSALMPRIHPEKKNALADAVWSFEYILNSAECRKMRDKPILWKLYFQGKLIRPMISDHDLHIAITRHMLDMGLSKPLVKTIRKQIGRETCFIRPKAGSKEYFYITFMDSEIRKDKNDNEVYVRYGQMTPWVQVFITVVMTLFCIVIIVSALLMLYGVI